MRFTTTLLCQPQAEVHLLKYQLTEHISLTQVDDEAVLLDLDRGSYFGLNAVGAEFLTQLQSGATFEEAADAISELFNAPLDTVTADLQALVTQLLDSQLIKARCA